MEGMKLAEEKLASYIGVSHALLTSMGRTALIIAMKALEIGPGDEVIIPSFTCDAVTKSVEFCGAKPIFADVDPLTFNIDPQQVKNIITKNTKAVLAIHCYGQPADIDEILDIKEKNGIAIVEDVAHALGAEYRKRKVGSFGDISIFSFSKNMGCSSGGALVTDSDELMSKARDVYGGLSAEESLLDRLKHKTKRGLLSFGRRERSVLSYLKLLGAARKFAHSAPGTVPELFSADEHVAVQVVKGLRSMYQKNRERRKRAQILTNVITDLKVDYVTPPFEKKGRTHVYYIYGLKVNRRKIIDNLRRIEKYTYWSLPWQCPYGYTAKELSRKLVLFEMGSIDGEALPLIVYALSPSK